MKKTLREEIEEDSGVPLIPSQGELQSLGYLVLWRDKLLTEKAVLEDKLKSTTDELRDIDGRAIPELLMSANMKKFTTSDGREVSYKMEYYGSANSPEAIQWLVENGHEGLIKRQFKIPLDRGESETADKLVQSLTRIGVSFEEAETVHPQTLKAWLREQIESGKTIPLTIFAVHTEFKTTVKKK